MKIEWLVAHVQAAGSQISVESEVSWWFLSFWANLSSFVAREPLRDLETPSTTRQKSAQTFAGTIFQLFLPLSFQILCPLQHPCNSLFSQHLQHVSLPLPLSVPTICIFPCFLHLAPFPIQKRAFRTACCLKTHKKNTCSPFLGTMAGRLEWGSLNTCRIHTFCYITDAIAH